MRKHPFDLTSLLAGLVFVAVAAVYLLGQATGNSIDATWVLPVALVALGLAGLAGGIGRVAKRPVPVTEPVTEPVAEPVTESVTAEQIADDSATAETRPVDDE